MRRLVVVGLVAALLVGAIPVGAVTGAEPTRDVSATPKSLGAADDFDSVEFHITVYHNGTAKWTFAYQQTLNNESERQQFKQFATEFNNNSTQLYTDFKQQASRLTNAGRNTTQRPMAAESFSKNAKVDGINNNLGIVTMSFKWSAFAKADGDLTVIGDVFEGGLYIGPNQSLVVHAGPELKFASMDPSKSASMSGEDLASSESVTWEGEQDFTDRRPRVKFEMVKQTTVTTQTNGNGSGGTSNNQTQNGSAGQPPGGDGNRNSGSPLMLFVAAVVLLLGLAAAFAWRQGDFGSLTGGNNSTPGNGGNGGASAATRRPGDSSSKPSVSDEELLTDEARVRKLLDKNGGRMKQVNIVDETGWSKSKVSMLLSEMEEEGDISKLRVGRENIISLEGHEPDAAGSPLEDSG